MIGLRAHVAKTGARAGAYIASWACFYVLLVLGWYAYPEGIWGVYSLVDGRWAAWNAEFVARWGKFLDPSPFNIFSGMGSWFLPNLPWLNPAAWSLALPLDRMTTFWISYTIYVFEIAASIVLLMRVLGFPPATSHLAAQIHVFFLFPPFSHYFHSLPWYSLAPFNAHLGAIANGLLALILMTGQFGILGNVGCVAGIVVLTMVGILSAPMTFVSFFPVYGLLGAVLVFSRRLTLGTFLWKCGCVVATASILLVLGVATYYQGSIITSARYLLHPSPTGSLQAAFSLDTWGGLLRSYPLCEAPQTLLCGQYKVVYFKALALLGATWWIITGGRWQRMLAIVFVALEAFVHWYYYASIISLLGKAHIVSLGYLVWSSYTFYALFSTVVLLVPSDLWKAWRTRRQGWRGLPGSTGPVSNGIVILGVIPLLAAIVWFWRPAPMPPWPLEVRGVGGTFASRVHEPAKTPIVVHLMENAGLRLGGPFRGYVAAYFGDSRGHLRRALNYSGSNFSHQIYVDARQYLEDHYGNRFMETDLWYFSIPTFEEYGQWISGQIMAFTKELLATDGDVFHWNFLRAYKVDIDLMQTLGIRFLVTDIAVFDPRAVLVRMEKAPAAGPIYLYEFIHPNLGTYSPTEIVTATSFRETIGAIRRNVTPLDRRVVVNEDLRGHFVPVSLAEMRVVRDGIRVKAESPGRSLLLLPVQFSRCLTVRTAESGTLGVPVRLLRANLIQTLVEFNGQIDAVVEFQFGFFGSGQCRSRDAMEWNALHGSSPMIR